MTQGHAKTSGQVLSTLNVSAHAGLTERQARERLSRYGPNKLAGVEINRKMLAELAVNDKAAFTQLTELAKGKLA